MDIDDDEVDDLNIDNKDILHLNDGGDLNCNIEDEHEQGNQHNHFGGPIFEKHQPYNPIAEHDENNNINEEHDDSCFIIKDELSNNDEYDLNDDHMS